MKIINNILVPTDFSGCAENAYHYSLHLANNWKSSIKLLHIVSPDYGVTDLPVIVDLATKEKIIVAQQLLNDFKEIGLSKFDAQQGEAPTVSDAIKVSGLSPECHFLKRVSPTQWTRRYGTWTSYVVT